LYGGVIDDWAPSDKVIYAYTHSSPEQAST
jgi:hypothetical protein